MKRGCGTCTLCCKLIPVTELNKKAGERCEHQRMTGCRIYHQRPNSCRKWSCSWLINNVNDAPVPLPRPDRAHYVIDSMPDFVTLQDGNTGEEINIPVLQIWCDPDHPDAHRDPALRDWLNEQGKHGIGALIRFGSHGEAISLFPPSIASDGQWHEYKGGGIRRQHTAAEIAKVVSYEPTFGS